MTGREMIRRNRVMYIDVGRTLISGGSDWSRSAENDAH